MFRRRTDQVYATLQQVQRRITEQAGTQRGATAESPPAQANSPLQDAVARSARPQLMAMQPEAPPLPLSLGQPPRGTVFLSISKSLALTLLVLWLATDMGFFILGSHRGLDHDPGAGPGAGLSGNRVPGPAATQPISGPYVLLLRSIPDPAPDQAAHLEKQAADLNQTMLTNQAVHPNWRPWFGVRRPENGELQLVFGETSAGVFGISRDGWEDFALILRKPPPTGAGYANTTWLQLK